MKVTGSQSTKTYSKAIVSLHSIECPPSRLFQIFYCMLSCIFFLVSFSLGLDVLKSILCCVSLIIYFILFVCFWLYCVSGDLPYNEQIASMHRFYMSSSDWDEWFHPHRETQTKCFLQVNLRFAYIICIFSLLKLPQLLILSKSRPKRLLFTS